MIEDKYYITLDDDLLCSGRYLESWHGANIPANAIEVPKETWDLVLHREYQYIVEDGSCIPYVAPPLSLSTCKKYKLDLVNREADKVLKSITDSFPQSELLSWAKQEAQAEAYLADNTVSVPLLETIAARRGITVADLAQRVMDKAVLFELATGDIIGQRQAYEDQVNAATTNEEVDAITVSYVIPS